MAPKVEVEATEAAAASHVLPRLAEPVAGNLSGGGASSVRVEELVEDSSEASPVTAIGECTDGNDGNTPSVVWEPEQGVEGSSSSSSREVVDDSDHNPFAQQ